MVPNSSESARPPNMGHFAYVDTQLILSKIPGTKRVDHKRAVKIYERAAGDKTLPSDLRPPPVLKVCPALSV